MSDEVLVLRLVLALEVVEELAAVVDLAEQAVAGRMVLLVGLQVLRERLDLLGEKRDLHFGRARVAVMALELGTDGGFVNLHFLLLSFVICTRSGAKDPYPQRACANSNIRRNWRTPATGRNLLRRSQERRIVYHNPLHPSTPS